jgi:hypothetical protein
LMRFGLLKPYLQYNNFRLGLLNEPSFSLHPCNEIGSTLNVVELVS